MSLASNIQDLATRVSTEAKALRTLINGNQANLSALTTTAKTSLVAAINELQGAVQAAAQSGGAAINDATTATTSVWSSSKTNSSITSAVSALVASSPTTLDTLNELAAALGNDPAFATTITNALGNRVRFDAAQTLTAAQSLQARTNMGAASAADVGSTTTNFVATFEAGLA